MMDGHTGGEHSSPADETQLFLRGEDERFRRQFAKFIPSSSHEQRKQRGSTTKYTDPSVRLIEAEERIASLQRSLSAKDREIDRLNATSHQTAKKLSECCVQNAALKSELGKALAQVKERQEEEKRLSGKLLLDDYRAALCKYYTWSVYLRKQCEAMKGFLEATGGWTETNRYSIYFSYKAIKPWEINDDEVQTKLAHGSVLDFVGIEEIESISDFQLVPRYRDTSCQTVDDETTSPRGNGQSFSLQLQVGSELSIPTTENPTGESNSIPSSVLSPNNLNLLDYRERIQRLECENHQLREIRVILRQKTHDNELLEEQRMDLKRQLDYARSQNDQLIAELEKLKECLSGETRRHSDASLDELKAKMAMFFKQRYQKEIDQLRAKLAEYEPLHPSDTTRVLRFRECNPLDAAYEEHVMSEAAANVSIPSSLQSLKGIKRQRMDSSSSDPQSNQSEERSEVVKSLQRQLMQHEKSADIQRQVAIQYRDIVAHLTGYQIKMGDEVCEVSSIANPQCSFFFKREADGEIKLLDGGSAREWQPLMDNYVGQHCSIPAFLAAVTLSSMDPNSTLLSTL